MTEDRKRVVKLINAQINESRDVLTTVLQEHRQDRRTVPEHMIPSWVIFTDKMSDAILYLSEAQRQLTEVTSQ